MDSFLFYGDYNRQIQTDNLQQVIGGNQTILDSIQQAAVEECNSYLKQKYDTSKALQNTVQFDLTKTYAAGQTVYLNAPAYDQTKTYALATLVLQSGSVYQCSTAITVAEAFNAAHWTLLGLQYALYYAITPQPLFNYLTIYAVGNQIFWKDKVYTCVITSQILDHEAQLQINQANYPQVINVFPDDPVNGAKYWGTGTAYSVPANTLISNVTYWTPGDNRDQKLLETCIKIALYHAHIRISPRNIPEMRVTNYMGEKDDRILANGRIIYPTYSALGWLQAAAAGIDIVPELPLIQPTQGARVRYGGNQKNINSY